jgi:hypothetical protein
MSVAFARHAWTEDEAKHAWMEESEDEFECALMDKSEDEASLIVSMKICSIPLDMVMRGRLASSRRVTRDERCANGAQSRHC